MSNYLKPQTPIQLNDNYIYPLTTADQVVTTTGERLNSLFKKTIKENATLQVANWSDTKPYTQTITLNYSVDDYNVDANVAYGDGDNAALNKAAGCISYIKKNHKEITFYCLKNKPAVDIPIEITGTCRNTIADVTVEEGIKLNFDIVGGTTQPVDPIENTIWVNTDTPITSWEFSATEPNSFREIELSCVSNNQWYLTCSQSLTVGNVLYFEIPASVTNTYEAINIMDPVTGNEYFIRNNDGSACTTWVKGTKICVVLSDDTNGLNGYGSTGKTAYIINDNSYGVAKGKVWICVGTSSSVEFNLLKENTAKIYPISAKQYVSGKWVDKTAMSYQNGEWVEWWNGNLYYSGNEYENITGGWYISRNYGGTLTKNNDSMVLKSTNQGSASSITMLNGMEIDYSEYNVIYVTISNFSKNSTNSDMYLSFRTGINHDTNTTISEYKHSNEISSETTLSLEIPKNETKIFFIYVFNGSVTIKKIWME